MGGKTSTTTQQVKIPPEVLARYNAVNRRAEDVAQTPFQIYGNDPSDFVAQLNARQIAGMDAIGPAVGSYAPYINQASASLAAGSGSAQPAELDIQRFMNPFQSEVIDATMRQMGQANEQAQSGALGTAISSGAFGGDRAGIAAANLANQQGLAMGSTLAGLNAENYSQALSAAQQQQGIELGATQADLERLMSGAQLYAGLGQAAQGMGLAGAEAMINAGTLGQQTEQAGLTALYNQFMQKQAYPFQVAQFLGNIAMGTGALSGSTTTTTQPAPLFSDRRLKEDIRRIGHTDDGLPIYKFKYKGDENHQTHVGFMADEVEQVKPEAVGVSGGYKTVDYDRATKADGGGVAGPYGMQVGSQSPYMAGYVPDAYLPVGDLVVADGSILSNAEQSMAQHLEAAANFGSNIVELRETFGKNGTFWDRNPQRGAEGASGAKVDPDVDADGTRFSHAGAAGFALGGATYLRGNQGAAENPVGGDSYLADTVDKQEEDRKDQLKQPGSAPGQQQSTLGQIGSAAGSISNIIGLGSMLFGLSDRRAKHSIRRIGRTDHGMPIYSFKYKGDNREQTHIGFMADEVEKDHPGSVMRGPDGMKRVDYAQAHKFYQGGVVRPAFKDGGAENEETTGERISRLFFPMRYAVTDRIPNAALGFGSSGVAKLQSGAGYAVAAAGFPNAADYLFEAAENSRDRADDFYDAAGQQLVPVSMDDVRPTDQQSAALQAILEASRAEMSKKMDLVPPTANGLIPTEYGRMLSDPSSAMPPAPSSTAPVATAPVATAPVATGTKLTFGDLAAPASGGVAYPAIPATGTKLTFGDLAAPGLSYGMASPAIPATGTKLTFGDLAAPASGGVAGGVVPAPAAEEPAAPSVGYIAVAGAGRGYTDVILPDGTVERREGTRNWRNNNPGNIEYGEFAKANGAIGSDGRFAVFPTYEAGRAAKKNLLFGSEAYAGLTIASAISKYAPASDGNDPVGYAANVAAEIGVDPNTPLSDLSAGQREAMLTAMERVEGGGAGNDYNLGSASTYPASGDRPVPAEGGVAGPRVRASEKPYEERTTVGKMFYNPDGSVNKNAILSILSGLATMASSPSRYLGSAILQGLGGAANTYAALENMQADIAGKNIDNMSELYKLYQDAMFVDPAVADMTIEDFAKANGLEKLLPEGGIDYETTTGGFDVTGRGGDNLTLQDMRGTITTTDGTEISAMDDYGTLKRFVAQYPGAVAGTRIGDAVAQANARIAEIEALGYTIGKKDGETVSVPVSAVQSMLGGSAIFAYNVGATQDFLKQATERTPAIASDIGRVDRQVKLFTELEGGSFNTVEAIVGGIAKELGLELNGEDDIAKVQEAIKDQARSVMSNNRAVTDADRARLESMTAGPDLQPEAIKQILAVERATLELEKELYAGFAEWHDRTGSYDMSAYLQEFYKEHPFDEKVKEVLAKMPLFAGEEITSENAPVGTTSVDKDDNPIYKGDDGRWHLVIKKGN